MPKIEIKRIPTTKNDIRTNNQLSKIKEIASILKIDFKSAHELKFFFSPEKLQESISNFKGEEMKDELELQLVQDLVKDWQMIFYNVERKIKLSGAMTKMESNIDSALKQYWGPLATTKFNRLNMSVVCSHPDGLHALIK